MKRVINLLVAILLFGAPLFAQPSAIVGKWYTIDEDGNRKSVVQIYKAQGGSYEGKIEILLTGDPERRCVNCTGAKQNLKIKGMIVVSGMSPDGDKLSGGKILDPANGKEYNCTMSIDKKSGNLKVRGSLDKSGIIGRNQTWIRVVNQ
ncbi:MAG: hypothetical protein BGO30_10225 [Bacteroidetes bacterium 41-46]|jgi:uncharacterized protein (DUF2147 family)|nr:MAG: hypothetical protein BGO30_10225 [Bacteroidetes bacterium 41-46]